MSKTGTLADVARLKQHAGAGIEGVIIGQALYTGAVSLPEVIQVTRIAPGASM